MFSPQLWNRLSSEVCWYMYIAEISTGKLRFVSKANLVYNFSCRVYFFSLHVSGEYVPIIRRNNCIYATLGTVWYAGCTLHTGQYQVSHKYSCFSWLWAHSHPKHVEKRNKHDKKNYAPSWLCLQDCTEMHAQQNTKKLHFVDRKLITSVIFKFGCEWIHINNTLHRIYEYILRSKY